MTYGVAYQLLGEAALDYLNQREVQLGGYVSHITLFQPKDPISPPFPVLLYVATPSNQHWLGPQNLDIIAEQVVKMFIDNFEKQAYVTFSKHFKGLNDLH